MLFKEESVVFAVEPAEHRDYASIVRGVFVILSGDEV